MSDSGSNDDAPTSSIAHEPFREWSAGSSHRVRVTPLRATSRRVQAEGWRGRAARITSTLSGPARVTFVVDRRRHAPSWGASASAAEQRRTCSGSRNGGDGTASSFDELMAAFDGGRPRAFEPPRIHRRRPPGIEERIRRAPKALPKPPLGGFVEPPASELRLWISRSRASSSAGSVDRLRSPALPPLGLLLLSRCAHAHACH